uniref:Uncharacterized protein n=1 Tax=Oryza rufipogon TaxID=4529 RepID=A0A0E0PNB5_ORYRU
MGRQRGGRRQHRVTPVANKPPSKAMGDAAVTKADTGGTSRSVRQSALLHLKPEPKPICQTRWPRWTRPLASASYQSEPLLIKHFCACGYLDGGSKSNGRRRRRREPDAAAVFAPPLGYRPRQQLHFRRQASCGPAWPRAGSALAAWWWPRARRRWRRSGWRFVRAEMEVGGADNRGGEAAVARGWCSRGRCGRAWRQRPSVATAWRGGGEVKEVVGGGGEWPDERTFFFLTWHKGIYIRPRQKLDFRPPRQHNKYPLDDTVSISKYPRLWDVFPQNFTFTVSLSLNHKIVMFCSKICLIYKKARCFHYFRYATNMVFHTLL